MASYQCLSKFHQITNLLNIKSQLINNNHVLKRFLSYKPIIYDSNKDPGPIFIQKEIQNLLKTLTRIDLNKIYRHRKTGEKLQQPIYKFMTDEQLKEALDEANNRVNEQLQFPPILQVRQPKDKILSQDPALQGLDSSKFVFTDITFGLKHSDRLIVERDLDGTLQETDWKTRDRLLLIYFPRKQCMLKKPRMFDSPYLDNLLDRQEYQFILDRACLQFEPNDLEYQKITSITYQHINDNNRFDLLRSTRHFSSLAFFLAWHKLIDNLLLDLIENQKITEINALIHLYSKLNDIPIESDENLKSLEIYVEHYADKKIALELAVQTYKELVKKQQELDNGIRQAHGF